MVHGTVRSGKSWMPDQLNHVTVGCREQLELETVGSSRRQISEPLDVGTCSLRNNCITELLAERNINLRTIGSNRWIFGMLGSKKFKESYN